MAKGNGKGNGKRQWQNAMAKGNGKRQWQKAMAKGNGKGLQDSIEVVFPHHLDQ